MMKLLLEVFQSMGCPATNPMQLLLLACLQVVCNFPNSSLRDLWRFMDDQVNQDLVAHGKKHGNLDIRLFFTNQFHQQSMLVSKEGLKTRLFRLIGQARFTRLITGPSTINLTKAINQKKIIVFNLSKGRLGNDFSMIYGRFLLNSIMNILLARAVIPEKYRVATHLYVDEFHNYIDATMREVFTEGRKYKAHLTVATQMVGQQMSTDMKDTILGNANVKIIGKAGQKSQKALL
ncbi:MAG: type IV secretory system conjugative DNA transfer family protein [Bacteroidota bacterium]